MSILVQIHPPVPHPLRVSAAGFRGQTPPALQARLLPAISVLQEIMRHKRAFCTKDTIHHGQPRLRTTSEHGDVHTSTSRCNVPQLTESGTRNGPVCQICAPQLAIIDGAVTDHIGGSARVLPDPCPSLSVASIDVVGAA